MFPYIYIYILFCGRILDYLGLWTQSDNCFSGHLAHRSSAKASSHSRATTPTSPMFAKLFSAKQSAYSSRESICQVMSWLIVTLHLTLYSFSSWFRGARITRTVPVTRPLPASIFCLLTIRLAQPRQ